jgi:hypothetical protein
MLNNCSSASAARSYCPTVACLEIASLPPQGPSYPSNLRISRRKAIPYHPRSPSPTHPSIPCWPDSLSCCSPVNEFRGVI